MVLQAQGKIHHASKGKTLYMTIPAKLAEDSQCPVKHGDTVTITIEGVKLIIEKKMGGERQ